jgi:hypothetical protein
MSRAQAGPHRNRCLESTRFTRRCSPPLHIEGFPFHDFAVSSYRCYFHVFASALPCMCFKLTDRAGQFLGT